MPAEGEVRKGAEVGYKNSTKLTWHACETCGKERWVQFIKGQPRSLRCPACGYIESGKKRRGILKGERSPRWKGGRQIGRSYVRIWLSPDDFFYPMANKDGYVLEHRLVMAKHLGRCLQSWEIVHHKDSIGSHNDISNLQLVQEMQHNQITLLENRIRQLEEQVEEQVREIRLLKWQIKEGGRECLQSQKNNNG